MFDIRLNAIMAIDADLAPEGQSDHVDCHIIGGSAIPIAAPDGSGPIQFPSISVGFALDRETALKFAELLKEQAEKLPEEKKSSVYTAQSLREVERLAEAQRKMHDKAIPRRG